jgi:diguanylate cyclase (GGDEF)-like protein
LALRYLTQCLIGITLIVAMLALPVYAQNTKQTYRIAINKTSYPFHFINEEGKADGMMVDLWRLWGEKQAVELEFVPLNWQQTIQQVANGVVDIHAGLTKNPARAELLDFTSVLLRQNRHLFLHRSIAEIKSILDLKPYAIGVVDGSSHEFSLKNKYPNLTVKSFANRNDLYQAALTGEILIMAGVEKLSKNFSDYALLSQKFPAFARISYETGEYGAGVAKGQKPLLEFIQQGMDKISPKEKAAIKSKWLIVDSSENVITLSYSNNQMPFSGTSRAGNAQGFFIELWQMWAEYSGLDIEFVLGNSTEFNQTNINMADIHITSVTNEKSITDSTLGPVIYSINYGLFFANDIDKVLHISEIENKNIGVIRTPSFVKNIQDKVSNSSVIIFDDYQSMFAAAEKGELDVIAGQVDIVENYLIEYKLQSIFLKFYGYVFKRDVNATLNKIDLKLSELILEGFENLPLQDLVILEKKWHLDESSGYFNRQLSILALSEQEALWVKNNNVVKFGITRNWIPVEFIDKFDEVKGINPDLFDLLTKRLNLKIDYVVHENFNELYQALVAGEVDVIGSVVATQERKKQVLFTDSYWSMPWVILHPRELGTQLSLEDFNGKTLAIAKGYYLISIIRKKFPLIALRLVDDNEEGLLAIQKGIVDGFIDSLSSGTELLKRESLVSLSMSILEEVDKNGNHLAVNQSLPVLASILNKAVLSLSDLDSQQVYEKWFDINIETGLDKNVVLRVALQVGALIFIIIIVIMVWNRRLYQEIKNRKKLEQKMEYMATHDDLTGLANRVLLKDRLNKAITFHQRQKLLVAVLFIDLDGFKDINDTYGHDIGDELLIEIANRLKGCVRESDTVVRFGGDEFVLLLTGLHNQNEAGYVADKVLKIIQQPIQLPEVNAYIGCSIGIAMYPDDGDSDNELLKVADSLMYDVKAAGKNHYAFNRKSDTKV